jgi:hypothetical protein
MIEPEIAFDLERRIEHALTLHDPAGSNVIRRPIRHDADFIAFIE